jgi:hypothetical protein
MLAFFDTTVPREAERAIHIYLDEYRANPGREFFAAPAIEMLAAAQQWCDPNEGICFLKHLDQQADDEGREEAEYLGTILEERRNGTRT